MVIVCVALTISGWTSSSWAWDPDEVGELQPKVAEAIATLKEKGSDVQKFFDKASGYVVFPTVGKAGLGIGGARGKGLLMVGATLSP